MTEAEARAARANTLIIALVGAENALLLEQIRQMDNEAINRPYDTNADLLIAMIRAKAMDCGLLVRGK